MNGFALVLIFIVLIKWYLPLLLENGKRYFIRYPNARDVVRIHPVGNLPLNQELALVVNGRDITATGP